MYQMQVGKVKVQLSFAEKENRELKKSILKMLEYAYQNRIEQAFQKFSKA